MIMLLIEVINDNDQDGHEYESENDLIVEIVSGVCLQKVGKGHISIQATTGLDR